MLSLQEVFLKTTKETGENPNGSPRVVVRKAYWGRDCLINPDYVVAVYEHQFTTSTDQSMIAGQFPEGTQFCRVILDGNSFRSSEIIVASSFEKLQQQLK